MIIDTLKAMLEIERRLERHYETRSHALHLIHKIRAGMVETILEIALSGEGKAKGADKSNKM